MRYRTKLRQEPIEDWQLSAALTHLVVTATVKSKQLPLAFPPSSLVSARGFLENVNIMPD